MLPKFLMPELIVCIILSVAYFVYIGVKYRKTPNFGSSILWGLGSFLVINAITNVVTIVFIQIIGQEAIKTLNVDNPMLLTLIDSISRTAGVVFTGFFILKQVKRQKTKVYSKERAEMIGFIAGSGSIFSPINMQSTLLFFVQSIMNYMVINRNPTQEELGKISLEDIIKVKEAFMQRVPFEYLTIALTTIVSAYGIMMVYKCADAYFNEENRVVKYGVPSIGYFTLLMIIGIVALVISNPTIRVIIIVIIGAGLVYIDKFVLPKLPAFIALDESYNKTIVIDAEPAKKNKK